MKCLLCDFKSNEKSEVENHYLNFHNVDKNNIFFRRLFDEKIDVFHERRCVRCDEFNDEFNEFQRRNLNCIMNF